MPCVQALPLQLTCLRDFLSHPTSSAGRGNLKHSLHAKTREPRAGCRRPRVHPCCATLGAPASTMPDAVSIDSLHKAFGDNRVRDFRARMLHIMRVCVAEPHTRAGAAAPDGPCFSPPLQTPCVARVSSVFLETWATMHHLVSFWPLHGVDLHVAQHDFAVLMAPWVAAN